MPSSRRKKRAKASTPDPRLQQPLNNRVALRPEDVCVGCIAWLPSYLTVNQVLKCKNTGEALEETGYDHPVVVLSVEQGVTPNMRGDLTVSIAMLTSFNSTSLANYRLRSANAKYRHCLPIISPNPEMAITQPATSPPFLHLEDKATLRKQSYVRLRHIYTIPISNLQVYDFGRKSRVHQKRLDRESYRVLMGALNLPPEPFPPTDSLREISLARHEIPANSEPPHLLCGAAEYQQTIHQVIQPQALLSQTLADVPHPDPVLNPVLWSLYRPGLCPSPASTYRNYGTATYPPLSLPPPIPNKGTRHRQERRSCTRSISSYILQLSGIGFFVCAFWLVWRSYWRRG